jgi:hypothetical protein
MEASPNPRRVAAGKKNCKRRVGLTPEGRQQLRQIALVNKPWLHSTGPRTVNGKRISARNGKARQKGALSIRELRRATADVDIQIQDIHALLQNAKRVSANRSITHIETLPPLVESALHLLTDEINLSTGLSHASDRNKAKELLTRLHDAGELLNVTSITVWAREHGWLDADARDLGELAAKIESGGKVQVKDGPWWPNDVLELLQR